jgi:hypothetical protein
VTLRRGKHALVFTRPEPNPSVTVVPLANIVAATLRPAKLTVAAGVDVDAHLLELQLAGSGSGFTPFAIFPGEEAVAKDLLAYLESEALA